MKNLLLLATTSLIFFSCDSNLKSNKLIGNWYTCGKDGSYIEWYVKDETYKFCTDGLLEAQSEKYTISKDTIISQSPYKEIGNEVSKAIMHFKDNGDVELNYITSNENWIFHPLNAEIKPYPDELTFDEEVYKQYQEVVEDLKERQKLVNCPDTRTKDEIKQDSINSNINFQF